MKKNYKLIVCLLLVFALMIPSRHTISKADETEWMNQFLAQIGMSQEIIDTLSERKKQILCEYLDLNTIFLGYSEKHISFNSDGSAITAKNISDSDLTYSLALAKTNSSTDPTYIFFPSFTWHKIGKIKNDSFSCSLYPGWGIVDYEDSNLAVWLVNAYGDKPQSTSCLPKAGSDRAITFKLSDLPSIDMFYEGNAIFYAKDYTGNAMPFIYIHYLHDNTFSRRINYQILLPSLQVLDASSTNYIEKLENVPFNKIK